MAAEYNPFGSAKTARRKCDSDNPSSFMSTFGGAREPHSTTTSASSSCSSTFYGHSTIPGIQYSTSSGSGGVAPVHSHGSVASFGQSSHPSTTVPSMAVYSTSYPSTHGSLQPRMRQHSSSRPSFEAPAIIGTPQKPTAYLSQQPSADPRQAGGQRHRYDSSVAHSSTSLRPRRRRQPNLQSVMPKKPTLVSGQQMRDSTTAIAKKKTKKKTSGSVKQSTASPLVKSKEVTHELRISGRLPATLRLSHLRDALAAEHCGLDDFYHSSPVAVAIGNGSVEKQSTVIVVVNSYSQWRALAKLESITVSGVQCAIAAVPLAYKSGPGRVLVDDGVSAMTDLPLAAIRHLLPSTSPLLAQSSSEPTTTNLDDESAIDASAVSRKTMQVPSVELCTVQRRDSLRMETDSIPTARVDVVVAGGCNHSHSHTNQNHNSEETKSEEKKKEKTEELKPAKASVLESTLDKMLKDKPAMRSFKPGTVPSVQQLEKRSICDEPITASNTGHLPAIGFDDDHCDSDEETESENVDNGTADGNGNGEDEILHSAVLSVSKAGKSTVPMDTDTVMELASTRVSEMGTGKKKKASAMSRDEVHKMTKAMFAETRVRKKAFISATETAQIRKRKRVLADSVDFAMEKASARRKMPSQQSDTVSTTASRLRRKEFATGNSTHSQRQIQCSTRGKRKLSDSSDVLSSATVTGKPSAKRRKTQSVVSSGSAKMTSSMSAKNRDAAEKSRDVNGSSKTKRQIPTLGLLDSMADSRNSRAKAAKSALRLLALKKGASGSSLVAEKKRRKSRSGDVSDLIRSALAKSRKMTASTTSTLPTTSKPKMNGSSKRRGSVLATVGGGTVVFDNLRRPLKPPLPVAVEMKNMEVSTRFRKLFLDRMTKFACGFHRKMDPRLLAESLRQLEHYILTDSGGAPSTYKVLCGTTLTQVKKDKGICKVLEEMKSAKENAEKPATPYENLLLTVDQLHENNYPLRDRLVTGTGYMRLPKHNSAEDGYYDILAIDCEMCQTKDGSELVRVSIVDKELETIYDKLVKPFNAITDYVSKYSGVTAEILEPVRLRLSGVQKAICELADANTILVGHSLENDLKALKLVHSRVIDTAVLFSQRSARIGTHGTHYNIKCSLKKLTERYIGRCIQANNSRTAAERIEDVKSAEKTDATTVSSSAVAETDSKEEEEVSESATHCEAEAAAIGHSSVEDAVASMELVLKRLEWDRRRIGMGQNTTSLKTEITSCVSAESSEPKDMAASKQSSDISAVSKASEDSSKLLQTVLGTSPSNAIRLDDGNDANAVAENGVLGEGVSAEADESSDDSSEHSSDCILLAQLVAPMLQTAPAKKKKDVRSFLDSYTPSKVKATISARQLLSEEQMDGAKKDDAINDGFADFCEVVVATGKPDIFGETHPKSAKKMADVSPRQWVKRESSILSQESLSLLNASHETNTKVEEKSRMDRWRVDCQRNENMDSESAATHGLEPSPAASSSRKKVKKQPQTTAITTSAVSSSSYSKSMSKSKLKSKSKSKSKHKSKHKRRDEKKSKSGSKRKDEERKRKSERHKAERRDTGSKEAAEAAHEFVVGLCRAELRPHKKALSREQYSDIITKTVHKVVRRKGHKWDRHQLKLLKRNKAKVTAVAKAYFYKYKK